MDDSGGINYYRQTTATENIEAFCYSQLICQVAIFTVLVAINRLGFTT